MPNDHDQALCPHPMQALVAALGLRDLDTPVSLGPMDDGWAPIGSLWGPDRTAIDRLLAYQRAFSTDLNPRGQSAYLVAQQAYAVAVPLAAAVVGDGFAPDLAADDLAFRLEPRTFVFDGREVGGERMFLRFTSPRLATIDPAQAENPHVRCLHGDQALADHVRGELERLFQPLVEWLNAFSGLARAALWRLVGDSVAGAFLEAGLTLGRVDQAKRQALAILKHPGSPLANKQLRFIAFELHDPDAPGVALARQHVRARGGCCRYYTVEGGSYCTTCVLIDPEERSRRILHALRDELGDARVNGVLREIG